MPTSIARRHRRSVNEMNMVPFIDVMLVLLIIFMVTAPLLTPNMIDLPSVSQAPRQPDRVIQIGVRKNQGLTLKVDQIESPVSLEQIAERVLQMQKTATPTPLDAPSRGAATSPNWAVVISAEKTVPYEQVVQVMDRLQSAGVARVGLSVHLLPQ